MPRGERGGCTREGGGCFKDLMQGLGLKSKTKSVCSGHKLSTKWITSLRLAGVTSSQLRPRKGSAAFTPIPPAAELSHQCACSLPALTNLSMSSMAAPPDVRSVTRSPWCLPSSCQLPLMTCARRHALLGQRHLTMQHALYSLSSEPQDVSEQTTNPGSSHGLVLLDCAALRPSP